MQGNKTHEQQLRILERKDLPDGDQTAKHRPPAGVMPSQNQQSRESEFPVSRGGLRQESRDHNKHNRSGQTGHKPQQHGPAEEKH
jgi:hypothetical protein